MKRTNMLLNKACGTGNKDIVKFLIDNHYVDILDMDSAMSSAIRNGKPEIAAFLAEEELKCENIVRHNMRFNVSGRPIYMNYIAATGAQPPSPGYNFNHQDNHLTPPFMGYPSNYNQQQWQSGPSPFASPFQQQHPGRYDGNLEKEQNIDKTQLSEKQVADFTIAELSPKNELSAIDTILASLESILLVERVNLGECTTNYSKLHFNDKINNIERNILTLKELSKSLNENKPIEFDAEKTQEILSNKCNPNFTQVALSGKANPAIHELFGCKAYPENPAEILQRALSYKALTETKIDKMFMELDNIIQSLNNNCHVARSKSDSDMQKDLESNVDVVMEIQNRIKKIFE